MNNFSEHLMKILFDRYRLFYSYNVFSMYVRNCSGNVTGRESFFQSFKIFLLASFWNWCFTTIWYYFHRNIHSFLLQRNHFWNCCEEHLIIASDICFKNESCLILTNQSRLDPLILLFYLKIINFHVFSFKLFFIFHFFYLYFFYVFCCDDNPNSNCCNNCVLILQLNWFHDWKHKTLTYKREYKKTISTINRRYFSRTWKEQITSRRNGGDSAWYSKYVTQDGKKT